ncbi:MAG: radical SAM family heme chaperone HemW [Oscillospiraceae bacterium]|nr:radical SAM family heme chaperone HemW [Oscillospiraceae bacterium]
MNKKNVGLYIHVPFCAGKCNYCDFYSLTPTDDMIARYTSSVCDEIKSYCKTYPLSFDTIYLGGGTPTLIGYENIDKILSVCFDVGIAPKAEITVEANPCTVTHDLIKGLVGTGVNRISLGVQSAIDSELKLLGRRHTADIAKSAVDIIHKCGIDNLSLDLMLGIPNQTETTLRQSIEFCAGLSPTHISAYILKIEQGTPFYKMQNSLLLPDEDSEADYYLTACELLSKYGYKQYEISNFCKKGSESRHNLRYWKCEEYIGIGAGAHSYFNGRRYFYERDLKGYLNGTLKPIDDGVGGSFEEKLMLGLRLSFGVDLQSIGADEKTISAILQKAKKFEKAGLLNITNSNISLTRDGFLLSNSIISELI